MLEQYVIYYNPKDYPGKYVVRRWEIFKGFIRADPKPWAVYEGLIEARKSIPNGLFNLGRDNADDSVIVEVWV